MIRGSCTYDYIYQPIMILDSSFNIKYANKAFLTAFNMKKDNVINKNVENFKNIDTIKCIIKNKSEIKNRKCSSINAEGKVISFVFGNDGDISVIWDMIIHGGEKVTSVSSIIGKNNEFLKVLKTAGKVAPTDVSVVIYGESGTGKELLADLIHNESVRKNGPFVKINCAAFPQGLLESELFGYEKGAFTGAIKDKKGIFEIADGGTLFLDEIGELPLEMQAKLLRVLQSGEIQRLGSEQKKISNVRVIAATNRNLEEMIVEGKFRLDLFYRISVISLQLPPLRKRKDDLEELVNHFIEVMNKKNGTHIWGITTRALNMLKLYNWPGNIRELMNVIERMVVLANEDYLDIDDLPQNIKAVVCEDDSECAMESFLRNGKISKIEDYEREIIRAALERYGSFNAAAKALGLSHATVASKAKKYQIIGE